MEMFWDSVETMAAFEDTVKGLHFEDMKSPLQIVGSDLMPVSESVWQSERTTSTLLANVRETIWQSEETTWTPLTHLSEAEQTYNLPVMQHSDTPHLQPLVSCCPVTFGPSAGLCGGGDTTSPTNTIELHNLQPFAYLNGRPLHATGAGDFIPFSVCPTFSTSHPEPLQSYLDAGVITEHKVKESITVNQILGQKWNALKSEDKEKNFLLARKEQKLDPDWTLSSSVPKKKQRTTTTVSRDEGREKTVQKTRKRAHPVVKKPPNAFMLFLKEQRPIVSAQPNVKDSAAVNQIVGQKWNTLTEEEKEKYFQLAHEEKLLHAQQHPDWTPNKKKRKTEEDHG